MIENQLKIIQTKNQLQTTIQNELRDAQAKIPSLREQFRAAETALARMAIRAPAAGTVVAAQINTVGSVVRPGETILEIVPQDDRLLVEVQVHTSDVDSIKVGLDTEIKFTGLSQRTTAPVHGKVIYVSADALRDPRTNAPYFVAQVDVPRGQLRELGGAVLTPGMPASVLIKTGERTAMAYLTQPLRESINRAWRE
jgi:HlyD family type I secretion membrane fusion protein